VPSAGARPGALRSRTRGLLRLYSPPSGFLSRRWGLPPHTPAFRCARLVLQTAHYRGQRSAWQVGATDPTPPLFAALGLSCRGLATAGNKMLGRRGSRDHVLAFRCARLVCRRLATAGKEILGRWGLPPPVVCLANGSLPRATKCLASFALKVYKDDTCVALTAAVALADCFFVVGTPPPPPKPLFAALGFTCGGLAAASN
jgi:hypothetical protein